MSLHIVFVEKLQIQRRTQIRFIKLMPGNYHGVGGSCVLGSHLEGVFACGFSYYFILQEVCLWVNVEAEETLLCILEV